MSNREKIEPWRCARCGQMTTDRMKGLDARPIELCDDCFHLNPVQEAKRKHENEIRLRKRLLGEEGD